MSQESVAGSLWQGVLSRIRGRVTEQQFETWFRAVEPTTCSEDVLELTVPNSFSREWLRKKYADLILGAVEQANGGRRPTLRILVREGGESARGVAVADRPQTADLTGNDPTSQGDSHDQTVRVESVEPARPHPSPSGGGFHAAPEPVAPAQAWLNREYRFENFVVGPGNRLPYAAAMAVVEKDIRIYNPLFVHGGVGLGKTHLLQAICQAFLERKPNQKVLFVSCEQFLNQFISAVDRGDLDGFRDRHRSVDVLVVDDIHFLSQKERTQEEFFHTFNALYNAQKQIILSADLPPRELTGLSDRLLSRFKWGMVCEIEAPGFESRLDIVRQKAALLRSEVPEEVARFVAEHIRTNVRELEGAVTRVVGYAHLSGVEVDLALARDALKDLVVERRRRVTIDHIAQAVTRHYGVKLAELQSKKRTQAVAVPRQVCMFLARRLTGHSLEEIGGFFGGRDHSTVLYGVERITSKAGEDQDLRDLVEQLGAQSLALAAS